MSRTFSVVVLCPNGRREVVKVTPNDSILQVLEEACKKQKISAEDYNIRHYNKTLDLSLPIRFANLPNNAQLELRPAEKSRQDSMVTIGLQLESGERLMGDFPPTATIENILEKSLKTEITTVHESGEPVCIYMRQKITGDAIKSTTLRSLGLIKGTAIIRLLYRKPEELEDQAHISSPLTATASKQLSTPQSIEPQPSVSPTPAPMKKQPRIDIPAEEEKLPQKFDSKIKEENILMEVDDNESLNVGVKNESDFKQEIQDVDAKENIKEFNTHGEMECNLELEEDTFEGISDIKYIGERHAVIYSLNDITDVKKADLSDEFFDLTIKDAKYLMTDYRKQREQFVNQPLLTKEQRQNQILQQFARYTQTVVRVYFPERLVLQAVFNVNETVQTVSDFLRSYLEDDRLTFYLYITPPKEKLNPSKTLVEAMLVPAAVVYFGCDSQRPSYLSENIRSQLSDPRAAALAAFESRKGDSSNEFSSTILPAFNSNIVVEENITVQNATLTTNTVQNTTNKPQENLPKWLKLSKK
ncbi:hypothetical protein JTE90_019519 [Oedothorax gibbosus]|uniref:Tether containing UBX domain for GLUT4 n=1 Tax=Oedothorax gibbosus TaxID=931172 RepID=A0AAV6VHC0_9ARAC|nr:hypothetical protein JTE90_019519 [Oedothorax gibbosus]